MSSIFKSVRVLSSLMVPLATYFPNSIARTLFRTDAR